MRILFSLGTKRNEKSGIGSTVSDFPNLVHGGEPRSREMQLLNVFERAYMRLNVFSQRMLSDVGYGCEQLLNERVPGYI